MTYTKKEQLHLDEIKDAIDALEDTLVETIESFGNGTEYSVVIGVVTNMVARTLDIESNYSDEKALSKAVFEWMIDNGYRPTKALNKSLRGIITVLSGCAIKANVMDEKFTKPYQEAESNEFSYKTKGHLLRKNETSWKQRAFQAKKAKKVLRIKEVPLSILKLYRDIMQYEKKGALKNESIVGYTTRLDREVEAVIDAMGMEFRNFNKFASHGRNYSLMTMITSNKFLSSLVESAEPHEITPDNIQDLKWWIYVNVVGKATREDAIESYDGRTVVAWLKSEERKFKDVKTYTSKKLGQYLRVKEAYVIIKNNLKKTHFIPDWDMVNCGFVSLANQMRTPQLLKTANLESKEMSYDTHTMFQEALKLPTRDDAKKVDTPYIHGSSIAGMLNKAKASNPEIEDIDDLIAMLKPILGDSYNVPAQIAEFGKAIHAKGNSTIEFPNPLNNGMVQSVGYTRKTNIPLVHDGFKFTVVRDMPVMRTLPTAHLGTVGESKKTVTKALGLFACQIHSLDNAMVQNLYNKDLVVYDKFDAFYSWEPLKVTDCVFDTLEQTKDYLKDTLEYLSKKYKVKAPQLVYGDSKIINTGMFLAP